MDITYVFIVINFFSSIETINIFITILVLSESKNWLNQFPISKYFSLIIVIIIINLKKSERLSMITDKNNWY